MRFIFFIFPVSLITAWNANWRYQGDISVENTWLDSNFSQSYNLEGCAKLYVNETCRNHRCSGSARRTENNSRDSENDRIVKWKRCTESKIRQIKALAPNVVKEIQGEIQGFPSCMPTTTVSVSSDCETIPKETMTKEPTRG